MGFNPVFDPTGQGPFDWVGDGQEKYENGRRYILTNGQWVDYGPGQPPVEPIDNNVAPWGTGPKPGEGDVEVVEGVTFKKINGKWVRQPSTGATGGLLGQIGDETDRLGGTNVAQDPYREETSPLAMYMKQYGISSLAQNPYGKWLMAQFAPTYGAYQANAYNTPTTATWQDYLANQGWQGARGQGGDIMSRYNTMTPVGRMQFEDYMGDYLNDIYGLGARGRYAAPYASYLTSQASSPLTKELYKGEAAGNVNLTFLDYIRQKLGY